MRFMLAKGTALTGHIELASHRRSFWIPKPFRPQSRFRPSHILADSEPSEVPNLP